MEAKRISTDDVIVTLSFSRAEADLMQEFISRFLTGRALLDEFKEADADKAVDKALRTAGMLNQLNSNLKG